MYRLFKKYLIFRILRYLDISSKNVDIVLQMAMMNII